jgi:tRNA-2-methylthio-N6-dimethylallyladenosine synthase
MELKKNPNNLVSKKIFIKTFGCQMNEYDSNRILDFVKTIGIDEVKSKKDADCYILNTCHIRDKAKEKVYHEIGRVKKELKNLKKPMVIIAGCVAQAESDEMIKREPYIDMVIGPQSYHKLNDRILNYFVKNKKINETEFDVVSKFDELDKIKNNSNKISSYLTIQEGCDKFCHFCVVPYTRGPEFSRPFNQIIKEAKELANNGSKEIILLGQNVNAYNYTDFKSKKYDLADLILELEKIEKIKRIRFTTSHPKDMSDKIIDCYKLSKKLMPILHLPVQSGSDKVLKNMNRKHNIKFYEDILKKLKSLNQNIEISSDFIIGYPSETDKDFNQTLELIKKFKFINSYSYIFSPRPGTPASNLKLVNNELAHTRLKIIQDELYKIQLIKNKEMENQEVEVLVENKMKDGINYFGRTSKMISVIINSSICKPGDIIKVKIISSNKNNLFGKHVIEKTKAA